METQRTSKPFALLRPVSEPWRPVVDPADVGVEPEVLAGIEQADTTAIDLETRGLDPFAPESCIVGLGVAWRTGSEIRSAYFVWPDLLDVQRAAVLAGLASAGSAVNGAVIAHNLPFDGYWLWAEAGAPAGLRPASAEPRWTHCTYGLYRRLASEGFPGQKWGLKEAQLDLLGWVETNESGIEQWLIDKGYVTNGPRRRPEATDEEHAARVREWVAAGAQARPDKGEMWRCPAAILGEYCILDCLSTLDLFDRVLRPALDRFPEFEEFHQEYWLPSVRLHWSQQATGIRLDGACARTHADFLRKEVERAAREVREGPLSESIALLEAAKLRELIEREPPQFKKQRVGKEPARFKKDGAESAAWKKWAERKAKPPEFRQDWLEWRSKMDAAGRGELPEYRFNPGSTEQLRALLFGDADLSIPAAVEWRLSSRKKKRKKIEVPIYILHGVHGEVELEGTDGGLPPVNASLYGILPPALGGPLQLLADAEQELGYVDSYLQRAVADRIHPGWRQPGTLTGRLAGAGGINLQQAPKSIEFMKMLVADPGTTWIEADARALEPHVLAQLSRDPALLALYGPGAQPHDVYLYSAAHYAVLGDAVRQHYDPTAVTTESVKAAKKALKRERDAAKVVVLAKSYGAGAGKIYSALRLRGFDLTQQDAQAISDSHDALYAVSGREFHQKLEGEWERRGGWVLNGVGIPTPVWEGLKKDLINRDVQSTGHDTHTIMLVETARALEASAVHYVGVVWDFHDQLIFAVRTEDSGAAMQAVREAGARVNAILAGEVCIHYEPKESKDMAEAKEAEFSWHAAGK